MRLPVPLTLAQVSLGATEWAQCKASEVVGGCAHWTECQVEGLVGAVLVAKASCGKFQKEGGVGLELQDM